MDYAAVANPTGQAATVGNGKAAMEFMGQWVPVVQAGAGKGLGDDLGFFPFPAVEGGKGTINEVAGIMVWDYTDRYSWIPAFFPGEGADLPWDGQLRPKPAYHALREALA